MWRVAFEDPNSKLVEIVSVADVDDDKRFDDSFMQIWKLKFGHKANFLFRLVKFLSWSSGKILKLKFGQHFAAYVWLELWSWILVKILKLGLVKILKFKFSRDADVWLRFWSWCMVEILKMKIDQYLCKNHSTPGSVVPLTMFSLSNWYKSSVGQWSDMGWTKNCQKHLDLRVECFCHSKWVVLQEVKKKLNPKISIVVQSSKVRPTSLGHKFKIRKMTGHPDIWRPPGAD